VEPPLVHTTHPEATALHVVALPDCGSTPVGHRPSSFWYLQVGAWLAFGAAMGLGRVGEMPAVAIVLVDGPFAALGFLATLALYRAFVALRIGEGARVRTVSLVVVLSYLAGMAWTAAFHLYLHGIAVPLIAGLRPGVALPIRRAPMLDNTVYNALTLVAWSTLYVGLLYRDLLQAQRDDALRAAAEARDAQLRMLAYQLNPHFLFNTLNSIRAMIDEDRGRARQMVTELARFLRYALVERPLHLAPLAEEVAAVQGYLAIEAIRFEDRLDVQVQVTPEAAECRVPAFLLNPLVENAITHGRPRHPGAPLLIRVSAELLADGRLRLVVESSGVLAVRHDATNARPDGGVGLRNVRQRLAHHYPGAHRFALDEDAGLVRVTIDIPAGCQSDDAR
jgi:hypothetical protein